MTTFARFAFVALVLIGACAKTAAEKPEAPEAPKEIAKTADGWDVFGAALTDGDWTSAQKLMADPDAFDGKTLRVEGAVDEVCKKKGCWMTMRDGDKMIRVRFKDYGFFVPMDCEKRVVRIEGVFSVKTISEADAKHYLEDAGKHDEAAKLKGDQKELGFMATGVRMK